MFTAGLLLSSCKVENVPALNSKLNYIQLLPQTYV